MSFLGSLTSPHSPDIGENADGGIFDFWISGKSLINKNCHELGQVTKHCKRNTETLKKIDDDLMSTNFYFIVIFPIYG